MEKELLFYLNLFMEQFPEMKPETEKFTRSFLIIKRYDKKEFLFERGMVQKELSYLCRGLMRKYYINEKGNKITTGFTSENEYATDYPSFLRQQPSKYFIECLEPSIVVQMPYQKLQEAYRSYKDSEMYGRLIAEKVLITQTDRIESFLFENAEERYLSFLEKHKNIINRISLTQLSSYIGIERQSLTRIRSKLLKK